VQLSTTIVAGISGATFVWYGARCFVSRAMVAEFERYQLPRYRVLTGALQVAGGVGLVVGLGYRPLLQLSAAGLAAMMFLGAIVHVRIRDPWQAAMPALALFGLNLFIAAAAA
jgi:hypothetical protein